jgi:hypothetical protein
VHHLRVGSDGAQAWQEHLQARWPELTARVDECGLNQTSTGRREKFYIRCSLSYAVGAERHATKIYSRNVPSPEIWQYPPDQIAPFEKWMDDHPQGTLIVVRYDPANHTKIVLVANMPGGGPRTRNNVNLLGFLAGSFLVLLTIARITWPRSFWQSRAFFHAAGGEPLGSKGTCRISDRTRCAGQ